jgi:hypothetical protein
MWPCDQYCLSVVACCRNKLNSGVNFRKKLESKTMDRPGGRNEIWLYWDEIILITRAVPKVMPRIYFRGNYNKYKEHNNTIWQSKLLDTKHYFGYVPSPAMNKSLHAALVPICTSQLFHNSYHGVVARKMSTQSIFHRYEQMEVRRRHIRTIRWVGSTQYWQCAPQSSNWFGAGRYRVAKDIPMLPPSFPTHWSRYSAPYTVPL